LEQSRHARRATSERVHIKGGDESLDGLEDGMEDVSLDGGGGMNGYREVTA
jgi:hypothetical protein